MLRPFSLSAAFRASLAGISRIHKDDFNASGSGRIQDKTLKLSKGPAVKTGPRALARLDSLADVGEILKDDFVGPNPLGLLDYCFRRFVVGKGYPPSLFTRDFF
jgi:hypothetical protein